MSSTYTPAARSLSSALPPEGPGEEIDSRAVDAIQRRALEAPIDPDARPGTGLAGMIAWNHRCNALLWEQEDQARRRDVPESDIARNKRAIDVYNQQRCDAVEVIDDQLLQAPDTVAPGPDAWLNSETAGSIIDRLSINLLKLHHMGLQAQRDDATPEHRDACAQKVERLQVQRADLLECLQRLLDGLKDGSCCFRIYRQFKMYNDPSLNPYLHAAPLQH